MAGAEGRRIEDNEIAHRKAVEDCRIWHMQGCRSCGIPHYALGHVTGGGSIGSDWRRANEARCATTIFGIN